MSISEKVKIPKEVAEAIESLSEKWEKRAFLQIRFYEHPESTHPEVNVILNHFNVFSEDGFSRLARALYIGYEVEKTPEEKIKECYENANDIKENMVLGDYFKGYKVGMKDTLNILGIKIEGINA